MASDHFWFFEAGAIVLVLVLARALGFWFDRRKRRGERAKERLGAEPVAAAPGA